MLITYDINGNELKGQELLEFEEKLEIAIKSIKTSYQSGARISDIAWQINGLYFANLYRYNHLKIGVNDCFDIIINPSDDEIDICELRVKDYTHDDLVVKLPVKNISVTFKNNLE